ncbi:MAG TPA: hypothetical protein VGL62_16135 [Vicinamibacterales bacterium]
MTPETIDASVPHHYPLAVRNSGIFSAIGLLMRSLPYALARFAVLFTFSVACIVWFTITMGGAAVAGRFIAPVFGVGWFVLCVVAAGWLWGAVLRYVLHLIECGHVAVLTELIVHGRVGNGSESMFAYGKRIVTEKFGQVNALFAMNLLVRGVVNAVHSTIEGVGHLLPIPGIEAIGNLVTAILRAATRYMDKVIFSYNLACGDPNPWQSAQQGLVYYAQDAKPLLKQAVWIVILEHVLSVLLWLVLLIPAALITAMLPHSVRNLGGLATIGIAALFALSARGAFLKPIFLIMVAVRFHELIEHQPINQEWVARLDGLSTKFRDLGQKAAAFVAPPSVQPAISPAAAAAPSSPPTA